MASVAGDSTHGRGRMGFTLIELTVVLAVIVTLALILTPSIANSINEARVARARNDCQTIASGLLPCLSAQASRLRLGQLDLGPNHD